MKATKECPEIVKELTPELATKIWKDLEDRLYKEKVSKEAVNHHLKQIKAQMGKIKNKLGYRSGITQCAITDCMRVIDKTLEKINR